MGKSDYENLCQAIMGNPKERKAKMKADSDALGKPDATFVVNEFDGDPEYDETWGLWKKGRGILKTRQMKNGLWDIHRIIRYTPEELKALKKLIR